MGLSSGNFGSDELREIAVEGCYIPTDIDLPFSKLFAHFRIQQGQADVLLGYTLDGIRVDPFTISLATLEPGGGTWEAGECLCNIPHPTLRDPMGTFGTLAPPGLLQPPVLINNVNGEFFATLTYTLDRDVTVDINVYGVQLSGPVAPFSVAFTPAGNLILNGPARNWDFTFSCDYDIDWQMSIGQVNGGIGETINFDSEPVTSYIQGPGAPPLTLPFNGSWENGENASPSFFGWADKKSISYKANVVNSIIISPSILTIPQIFEVDCDCVCPPVNTADLFRDCGDVPGENVPVGINLLANGEMSAGIGFGQFSIFGAGWATEYLLPSLTNNLLAAGAGRIANFTTNMFQVAGFPPALNVPALDSHSVAVNIDQFSGNAIFQWLNVPLDTNESYVFEANMARLFSPLTALLNFYNTAGALVFAVPITGSGAIGLWERPVTSFTFPAPTGVYRIEAVGISGPPNQVFAFDNITLREADLRNLGIETETGYSSTVRAVIDQVVETSGCNDDRRDAISGEILQRLSAPCGDPILTASVNMAAEIMCDYGNQNDPYAAPILNIFPATGFQVPPVDFLQFDAAGPDFLSPVEIAPYSVGPNIQLPIFSAGTAHIIWAGNGKHLHILTGTIPNRLNRIRTYDPITLQVVTDLFLTGTAFGAPIQTVIDGVNFGFNSIAYDPTDGQIWGLAQGVYAPAGPTPASQWWLINVATGVCTYHSEAPSPLIGAGPGFSQGSFAITTNGRWFYSSGPAPQTITGVTHAIEVAPSGNVAIAPLLFVTFPPSPNYYGLKMAAGPNGSLLTTIQDGFSAEEIYWIDPATTTPALIEGPAPEGFRDRVWGYSPFRTVPDNFPGVGDDTPLQFLRTWEQDCDGTFNPVDRTMDGEIYLPVGPVGKCASADGLFTHTACLSYVVPSTIIGYVTLDNLRDLTGAVEFNVPTVGSILNSVEQDDVTGEVLFFLDAPQQIVRVDPFTFTVLGTIPLVGGVFSVVHSAAYDSSTGNMWLFCSLGAGNPLDAYIVDTSTGIMTLQWSTIQSVPLTVVNVGAGFTTDGRLFITDLVNSADTNRRDTVTGLILATVTGAPLFWDTKFSMDFDDADLMYVNDSIGNTIEVYDISSGVAVLQGTFGGVADVGAFCLIRSLEIGPINVLRYFHKNMENNVVTTQDHNSITGDSLVIPDNAIISLCTASGGSGTAGNVQLTTEEGCAVGIPYTRVTHYSIDSFNVATTILVEYIDQFGAASVTPPVGWNIGDCFDGCTSINTVTEPGCANGVPYTRITEIYFDCGGNPTGLVQQTYRDDAGVDTLIQPAGWTLGACPLPLQPYVVTGETVTNVLTTTIIAGSTLVSFTIRHRSGTVFLQVGSSVGFNMDPGEVVTFNVDNDARGLLGQNVTIGAPAGSFRMLVQRRL